MKLNKLICLISVMVMSAFFCGCHELDVLDVYKLPDNMSDQLVLTFYSDNSNSDTFSSTKVSGKYKKFACSCFDDIEVFGAKLALPMDVSDLPDGFTIDNSSSYFSSAKMYFDGYKTEKVTLKFEGVTAATAEIMYPANSSVEEGRIVTLMFSSFLLEPNDAFRMGGELGYLSMDRADELLGECGKVYDRVYYLDNNRVISFYYFYDNDNVDPSLCCATEVILSTSGKTIS